MTDRVDEYARNRAILRSDRKRQAMTRLWDMAREALTVRANMGVKELRYSTDLLPGVEDARIRATFDRVVIDLRGVDWGRDKGDQTSTGEHERLRYVIDEAWLLGVATQPGG